MDRYLIGLVLIAVAVSSPAQTPSAKKRGQAAAKKSDANKPDANKPDAKKPDAESRGSAGSIEFSIRSVRSGHWSDPNTWEPTRLPRTGDRVRVSRGTRVVYDVASKEVIRLLQVVGTLTFLRDRDTELNVGVVKVQNHDGCSEDGFACDFEGVTDSGEPLALPEGDLPALEVGTLARPIPPQFTARIRLHYIEGMDKQSSPAIVCCAGRMDLHGAPMSRTWVKLDGDLKPGDTQVTLAEELHVDESLRDSNSRLGETRPRAETRSHGVTGWRVGDEVIVTGSKHHNSGTSGGFRKNPDRLNTEVRKIAAIEGRRITLNEPLKYEHFGTGDYRSEVANLSRNVIVESADPTGVRGHTMYHRYSQGGVSYARFAHLGKEGVLGRYAIHFHLCGDTMRGSQVLGASIFDSHNRWITIHGTSHLVVRDCVGFRSVGHGFFLEDGTEVFNVLDRNLGVQAYEGRPLPRQVLAFDPNDGAAYWWANGRNTFIRNVSCENDEYGFRYDSQKRSNFNSNLRVLMPDGKEQVVDIRTIPQYRFEQNEAHTEGLYGVVFAGTDGVGPDTRHPHMLKDLKIWQVHYGLRSQVPTMWVENLDLNRAHYGVYRPWFENHVYRNVRIAHSGTEPFNRGLDDDSLQHGPILVDGLTFIGGLYGPATPFIQISDDNATGKAVSHFRRVKVVRSELMRAPLVNLGVGPRPDPTTKQGVPIYLHDYYGPGRHAMVVSTRSPEYKADPKRFREDPPLTGDESRVAEVKDIELPKVLDPVDDLLPATIITSPAVGSAAKLVNGTLTVRGTTTDNLLTRRVIVNGVEAQSTDFNFHQWEVKLTGLKPGKHKLEAWAEDAAGNVEQMVHRVEVTLE